MFRGVSICLGSLLLLLVGAARLPAQTLWSLMPYRVDVCCLLPEEIERDSPQKERLLNRLVERLKVLHDGQWRVGLLLPEEQERAFLKEALSGLSTKTVPDSWRKVAVRDKVLVIAVERTAVGWKILVRDWDVKVERFGPLVEMCVPSWQSTLDAAVAAVEDAFVPVARIRLVENNAVRLDLQASLLSQNTSLAPPGVFLPLARYEDRDGNARAVIPLPWTILTSGQNQIGEEGSLAVQVVSGVRNPLVARRRGRVQLLAWAVRPRPGHSQIEFRSRQDSGRPLAGYEVHVQLQGTGDIRFLGRTDAKGRLEIPEIEAPWSILLIKHGRRLLAKVPFLSGYPEFSQLTLPDDDSRLLAEGYLMGVQDELVDLVTLRGILLARLRARIAAGDWDQAIQIRDQLLQLKSREIFSSELTRQQQKLFCPDPVGQRQIDTMFEETRRLVNLYLNPNEVEELVRQIAQKRPRKPESE